MFNFIRPIALGAVFSMPLLFGSSPAMELKLQPNQKFEHLTTIGFDIHVGLPKEYIENMKMGVLSQPTPDSFQLLQVLNNMIKNKEYPLVSGRGQYTCISTVQESKPDHYIVDTCIGSLKFTLQEGLYDNFSIAYNSAEPEKNFSNLPVPIDFDQIDKELKNWVSRSFQIAKDGTVEKIHNLGEAIETSLLSSERLEQFFEHFKQAKTPSELTGIALPKSAKQIGESWIASHYTIHPELQAQLPKGLVPDNLTMQKLTLLDSKEGIATIQVQMPLETSFKVSLQEGVDLILEGTLLKGVLKIEEATGLLCDAECTTDYSIKFLFKDQIFPYIGQAPDFLTIRLVATIGTELKKL